MPQAKLSVRIFTLTMCSPNSLWAGFEPGFYYTFVEGDLINKTSVAKVAPIALEDPFYSEVEALEAARGFYAETMADLLTLKDQDR